MSAPAFAWAFEKGHELGLSSSQLMLLLYMADQANCKGWFFTGLPRMAKYTRLSVRTIRDLIPVLAGQGLIRVDAKPGKPTMYYVLRQPQGEEATAAPAAGAGRANGAGQASASPQPRQPLPHHPGNSRHAPRQSSPPTPAATAPDPISTQVKTLDAREAREAKVLDSGKEEGGTPPPAPQPDTPPGSTPDPFVGADEAKAWMSQTLGRAVHLAGPEPEVVTEDTPISDPVDLERMAAQVEALAHELGQSKRRFAIPPGPQFTRWEQTEILASKRQWKQPTPEQLQAMYRAQGLHRGVP